MYRITLLDPIRKINRIFVVDSVDHPDIVKAQDEGFYEIIQIFDCSNWNITK